MELTETISGEKYATLGPIRLLLEHLRAVEEVSRYDEKGAASACAETRKENACGSPSLRRS